MLEKLSSIVPLSRLIRLTGQRLFLPFYHAIQGEQALPHIKHLYRLRSRKEFEKDLDFLLKHYSPISLEELLKHIKEGAILPKKAFHLSFDDGLREVYDIVAPILERKGIPATIFLNSAFVDNKNLFFRYKASLLIEKLEKKSYSEAVLKQIENRLKPIAGRTLKERLLNIDYAQKGILDGLAEILEFSYSDFLNTHAPYLTSRQINALISKGFTFGAHSIDHPLFNQLPAEEQYHQLKESIQFVQDTFKLSYKTFSFPFTDYGLDASLFQTIEKEQIADLTFGCAGLKKEAFKFHLQRFPMEGTSQPARQLLTNTYLYFVLKSFFGKNTIRRN